MPLEKPLREVTTCISLTWLRTRADRYPHYCKLGYGDYHIWFFDSSRKFCLLIRFRTVLKKINLVQENWILVCGTYVLGDNFAFDFWTTNDTKNVRYMTSFLLCVMIRLVLYAQKKNSTTNVLSKHSLGSKYAQCISEKIYCAKCFAIFTAKKSVLFLFWSKSNIRGKCYVFHNY